MHLCAVGDSTADYERVVPAVPPETRPRFPNWCYFNIYEISAWSRAILVPLSIIYAKKPFKKLTPEQENRRALRRWTSQRRSAPALGYKTPNQLAKFLSVVPTEWSTGSSASIRPLRRSPYPQGGSSGCWSTFERVRWPGCNLPGHAERHRGAARSPATPRAIRSSSVRATNSKSWVSTFLKESLYSTPTFRMQPCISSPVWDTAQVLSTLGDTGLSRRDPRLVKAADWLLSKEIRYKGDWSHKVKNVDASCWCFFFNNDHQPDVDDTGEVLLALKSVDNPRERYQHEVSTACGRLGLRYAVQERRLGLV